MPQVKNEAENPSAALLLATGELRHNPACATFKLGSSLHFATFSDTFTYCSQDAKCH